MFLHDYDGKLHGARSQYFIAFLVWLFVVLFVCLFASVMFSKKLLLTLLSLINA